MKKTPSLLRPLLLIASLIIGVETYANGDPVARFSSINRVANPEPLSISEIHIINEKINITHIDGYNCFDITYTLKNNSDKDFPEINYGFPIDYCVADELETYRFTGDYYTESLNEIGWNERLIKDIKFEFNNNTLPFHSSKESVREAGFVVETYDEESDSIPVDAVNRRWFYTAFAMKPRTEATLNVRYKVYANSSVGLYSCDNDISYYVRKSDDDKSFFNNLPFICRFFSDRFKILYDFTPAKHFGNATAFGIDIDIDLSNLDNPWIRTDDSYCFYVSHVKRYIYLSTWDIKPVDLTVNFNPDYSKEKLARIIELFKISEKEFEISEKGNTVSIDFKSPRFVSELACDIDTTNVKSFNSIIEYADGSIKKYKYEESDRSGFIVDHRIKSPILLTVTDLYHDGIIWSEDSIDFVSQTDGFDKDKFKIKSIKLIFNTESDSSSLSKNIKVLDSRL